MTNPSTVKPNNIKRAVSFYSFQQEYLLRQMTLEDCVAVSEKLDIPGIEIVTEQMVPGFPKVPDSFFEQWHGWMEKYGRTPVCHDQFLDMNLYKGRMMTEDEMVESMLRDIKFAHRLGCTVIRVIVDTPPEVIARSAPYAEEYNVKLGLEIHAPSHFDAPLIQNQLEMMERVGSPYLGVIPDFGIFVRRLPRILTERWLRDGMKESIANYVVEARESRTPPEKLEENILKLGGTQKDVATAIYSTYYMIWSDPRRMLDFMPRILHVHGKFYEMLPDYTEYSIPYEEIIPVLIEGGYDGYLSSEYEGQYHIQDAYEVDSVEQVRRHQVMLKRLLGQDGEE
jgi:sugar phosphate isomerase/epimerase